MTYNPALSENKWIPMLNWYDTEINRAVGTISGKRQNLRIWFKIIFVSRDKQTTSAYLQQSIRGKHSTIVIRFHFEIYLLWFIWIQSYSFFAYSYSFICWCSLWSALVLQVLICDYIWLCHVCHYVQMVWKCLFLTCITRAGECMTIYVCLYDS